MSFNRFLRRLGAIFKRDEVEQQLADEIRYHLERDAERHLQSGMSKDDARFAAMKAFGSVDLAKEECRDARGVNFIENLLRDFRYSVRLLLKNPAFTLVALLTLALGIGANTAIFSLVDAVLLRSLAIKEPEQLVLFGHGMDGGLTDGFPNKSADLFSYPFYQDVQRDNQVFSEVGALLSMTWTVHGTLGSSDAEPQRMEVQLVSGSYFHVLGINPRLGRLINDDDDKVSGMHPVAVVSHAWWRNQMGGDQSSIGKTLLIDKTQYTIIGVAPQSFTGTTVGMAPDVWIPLAMEPQLPPAHWNGRSEKFAQSLYLLGRLKQGVTLEQANAAVGVLFNRFLQDLAGPQPSAEALQNLQRARVELTPAGKGIDGVRRAFALPLKILMVVVAIVLLISCANIANLLLARAAVRKKEIALRLALGARRLSLIRQLIIESLIVAFVGGAAGFAMAWWGSRLLVAMASDGPRPLPLEVTPNIRVLSFSLLASAICAIVFGATPAIHATRVDLNDTLKDGKGTLQAGAQSRIGRMLVVAQVALSLVLMVGAGLFVRTLINLQAIPTGFDEKNAVLFKIDTATTGYEDAQMGNLLVEAQDRVKQVPGVDAASFSFFTFNQGGWTSSIYPLDQTAVEGDNQIVRQNVVGEDYFKAMGVPVISGRAFNNLDTENSQKVAIVSETLAKRFYGNQSVLGRRFGKREDKRDEIEIIGIVKDVKYESLTEQDRPMVYFTIKQRPQPLDNFVVRISGDPQTVIPAIRRTLREVNSKLPVDDVVTLRDHISRSLVQEKLIARLAAFFGVLALLLACIGLYGVLSYSVARRRNEIGIRMALGASTLDVLRLVLRNGMALTLIGLVLGVAGAFALTRLVKTLLFGVTSTDVTTFVVVSLTLIVVAFIACYIPARRATRVDPLTALRYD
jgi:predicted permease